MSKFGAMQRGAPGQRAIGVAVATYKRGRKLRDLMESLINQQLEGTTTLHIVVIDNDEHGSASEHMADYIDSAAATVQYFLEPEPGIAAARNRGVQALINCDHIAFIDDDEVADPLWITNLVKARIEYGTTLVSGPVNYIFDSSTPRWIKESGVFISPVQSTGSLLPYAATNNLMIDTDALMSTGVKFDPRYGLTGGSDTLLTATMVSAGHEITWVNEAVVSEAVDSTRVTLRWILKRATRTGNTHTRIQLELTKGPLIAARFKLASLGLVRIFSGAVATPLTLILQPSKIGRPMRTAFRGAGMLSATLGQNVYEYKR